MVFVLSISEADHARLASASSLTQPLIKTHSGHDLVLVQRGKAFTHIARGSFAQKSVTLTEIRALTRPIQFLELPALISKRLIAHALRVFAIGGKMPPKTSEATRAALVHLMPELKAYLSL